MSPYESLSGQEKKKALTNLPQCGRGKGRDQPGMQEWRTSSSSTLLLHFGTYFHPHTNIKNKNAPDESTLGRRHPNWQKFQTPWPAPNESTQTTGRAALEVGVKQQNTASDHSDTMSKRTQIYDLFSRHLALIDNLSLSTLALPFLGVCWYGGGSPADRLGGFPGLRYLPEGGRGRYFGGDLAVISVVKSGFFALPAVQNPYSDFYWMHNLWPLF